MADKKISQLTALSAANLAPSTDVLAIVDTSATETKKVTAKDLVDGALSGGTANGVLYLNGSKIVTSGSGLVFDSSGNLGLGVTPSASWFTGSKVFQFGATGAAWNNGSNNTAISHNAIFGNSTNTYITSSAASYYRQFNGQHNWFISTDVTPTAGNAITFTQAMTLNASGNLGVGTTSPADSSAFGRALDIQSSTGAAAYFRDSDDTTKFAVVGFFGFDSNAYYGSYGTGTGTIFLTGGTERARIDSSGNLLVGTTTGSYKIQSTVASGADRDMFLSGVEGVTNGVYWKWVNSTSKINVYFSALPTTASAANAYIDNGAGDQLLRSTSSIRYKKDIEDIDHEFADAALSLRPVWYRSKADSDNKDWSWYGLIAEEVAEVEPRLVHWAYPEDAFDVETVDGSIKKTVKEGAKRVPDGVQYERLSVLLLDIVKRQNARIESLEADMASLKGAK